MPEPIVSIVMAVYNGEKYLRRAVESILHQTFTDFEFIIVDDGSTDTTPVILDAYHDPRIVRLRNEKNIGQTRSLNRGLALAGGRYVARMDADDVAYPDRLASQVAFLDTHPEIVLLGSSYDVVDSVGSLIERRVAKVGNEALQCTLVRRNCFGHGTTMMRRDALVRVGGYYERLWSVQDYDLWLRLAEQGDIANLEAPLYAWRKLPTAKSSAEPSRWRERFSFMGRERMIVRRMSKISSRPDFSREDLAAALTTQAVSAALLEEWETARNALQEAWQLAGDWLRAGAFAEVVEEGIGLRASEWVGWAVMPALLQQILDRLPNGAKPRGVDALMGRLYRHAAFEAHVRGQPQQVRQAAWEYWRRRPLSLFTDRGMASIWLQSWRRRAHA
jgi:GT2 family glycosyltransferase